MVRLHDVFAQGLGFVLVFEYMLSDLSEMIHNIDMPLMEDQVKSYMEMLLRGKAIYIRLADMKNSVDNAVYGINMPASLLVFIFFPSGTLKS